MESSVRLVKFKNRQEEQMGVGLLVRNGYDVKSVSRDRYVITSNHCTFLKQKGIEYDVLQTERHE